MSWRDFMPAKSEPPQAADQAPPSDEPINPLTIEVGQRVRWGSPLFGDAEGVVAMPPERGWLVVRAHSVTGGLALVKVDWLTQVERHDSGG